MSKTKKILLVFCSVLVLALGFSLVSPAPSPVLANGAANVCPQGNGWVKVDNLSGLTYLYTAPAGKVVEESCYKAGSHDPVYQTYNPATSPVTVVSGVFNSPHGVKCTAVGVPDHACNYQELSHASFRVVDAPYVTCSVTTTVTHDWSLWTLVGDLFQRTQVIDQVDSRDSTHVCSTHTDVQTDTVCVWDPSKRTGDPECYDHYEVCDVTTPVTYDWSPWTLVGDLFQRTQVIDQVDSRDSTHVCSTHTDVQTDTVCVWDPSKRTGDPECYDHYQVCSVTNNVYGEWSDWMPVDGNPLQEYRTRTVNIVDSRDSSVSCGDSYVETDTRPVDFCTAYPNDASCVPCPITGKENLMSNDPGCKVPEKKPYIPPTVDLGCTSDVCLGNFGHSLWTDYVHPEKNEMIFFATATSGCYEVHGWNPGSDWVMPFRTVQLVAPKWIGELIGGKPFSAVLDGNIVQAKQGTDGYWRIPVKYGQDPILLEGLAPEGPYSASMLEDGTLVRWSGSFMGFDSQLGFLP